MSTLSTHTDFAVLKSAHCLFTIQFEGMNAAALTIRIYKIQVTSAESIFST